MSPLLITGSSGFVGRHLLSVLPATEFPDVRLLLREPGRSLPSAPGRQVIAGSLLDPVPLRSALRGCTTVLHLAALTGKAGRSAMFSANAEGTRVLLREAAAAGVERLILVSSVAAGFPDRRWYHYAESKRQAEDAVRASRLDWLILRPTMILGPGSPVLGGLARLARAPVGVMFGKGQVLLQPIHVADCVAILLSALRRRPLGRVVVEAGGPETITMADLLLRLRQRGRGGRTGPFLRLPVEPLRTLLGLTEPVLLPLLPFTAGQLASFVNAGTADPLPAGFPAPWRGLDQMLEADGG